MKKPRSKVCIKCGRRRNSKWFYTRKSTGRLDGNCKSCLLEMGKNWRSKNKEKVRNGWIKHKYGITSNQYDEMSKSQGGVCEICKIKSNNRLVVDHKHSDDSVRGLLCRNCNSALGMIFESLDTVLSMATYIQKYNGESK